MQEFQEPAAGRVELPKLIRAADPTAGAGPPAAARLVTRLGRKLAAAVARWRERRRARRRLEAWLSMDPRLLADIGLRPADVHAAVYAGAALGETARAPAPAARHLALAAPRLRVIAGDDLDAAA